MWRHPVRLIHGLLIAATCLALPVLAQDYPTRPVTFVIPFPTGGPVDLAGRLLGEAMTAHLGQPVVVENRSGASGTIGANRVATAAPDGYTLLFTAQTPITIAHHFVPKPPYDPAKDLVPVARTMSSPVLLIGTATGSVTDLRGFIEHARGQRGKVHYGAPGIGNEMHLMWEMIRLEAGLDVLAVPYKGTGPGLNDLMAGRIDVMVTAPAAVRSLLADGKVRALAVLADRRLPDYPNVGTLAENGLQNLSVPVPWIGLFAPAGTPPAVLDRIVAAAEAASRDPAFSSRMRTFGLDPTVVGREDFGREVARYRRAWDDVIQGAGIRFDGK